MLCLIDCSFDILSTVSQCLAEGILFNTSHEISSDSSLLKYKKATQNLHYPWAYLHLNDSLIQHYLLSWRKYRHTDYKRKHFFWQEKKVGAVKSFSDGGNLSSCMWRWRGEQSTGEAVRSSQSVNLSTPGNYHITCARKTVRMSIAGRYLEYFQKKKKCQ